MSSGLMPGHFIRARKLDIFEPNTRYDGTGTTYGYKVKNPKQQTFAALMLGIFDLNKEGRKKMRNRLEELGLVNKEEYRAQLIREGWTPPGKTPPPQLPKTKRPVKKRRTVRKKIKRKH